MVSAYNSGLGSLVRARDSRVTLSTQLYKRVLANLMLGVTLDRRALVLKGITYEERNESFLFIFM